MKKRILCYGDSNTWGFDSVGANPLIGLSGRLPENVRWTGVMSDLLGEEYKVLEAGMDGRTTVFDDPINSSRNGIKTIEATLLMTDPLDLVVVMLGTNDCKDRIGVFAEEIGRGLNLLINQMEKVRKESCSSSFKIMIVSPPFIKESKEGYMYCFTESAAKKSKELANYFKSVAEMHECYFVDAAEIIEAGDSDGVHLEKEAHQKLGEVLAEKIKKIV